MKELTNDKMQSISGGVGLAEYCGTLGFIMNNNGVSDAGLMEWDDHCGSTSAGRD